MLDVHLGTLRDENVGSEAIADYVLFKLNQNSIFDYVEQLELDQPYDDVKEMLTNFAIKKNMYRTLSRKFTGKCKNVQLKPDLAESWFLAFLDSTLILGTTNVQVPGIDDAAASFLGKFRRGELGKLIFDIQRWSNIPSEDRFEFWKWLPWN